MNECGDNLLELIKSASKQVRLIAPFIRSAALTRILESVGRGVQVEIITRWRPAEILAGASDTGIYEIAEELGIPLYLRNNLHAKLYIADNHCLVGSANLTEAALGWRTPMNLELLLPVSRASQEIVDLEDELLTGAVRVTSEIRDQMLTMIDLLGERELVVAQEALDEHTGPTLTPQDWVPSIRNPEDLYAVYSGFEDHIGRAIVPSVKEELKLLGVPPGLNQTEFEAWVAATIVQTPVTSAVIAYLKEQGPMDEAAMESLLKQHSQNLTRRDPRDVIDTLTRWIPYFTNIPLETRADTVKLMIAKKI